MNRVIIQTWEEFLEENYGITPEEFNEISQYEKHIINAEYDEMRRGI